MSMLLRRRKRIERERAVRPTATKVIKYSKSDIQRMSTENLKSLAIELGIEVTEESTGKVLKEQIIEKLGL